MLRRMSAREFNDWQQFDREFPFGDYRIEAEFARLRHMLAALVTPKGKPAPELYEFLWSYGTDEASQTRAKQQTLNRQILEAFGVKQRG